MLVSISVSLMSVTYRIPLRLCALSSTVQGRVIILNPSGPGVSEDIANALRRDHEVVGAKVSRLQDKVGTAVRLLVAPTGLANRVPPIHFLTAHVAPRPS